MTSATAAAPVAAEAPLRTVGSFTVAYEPNPAHVAGMRRITTAHLRRWHVPLPLAADVVVAVSELVTNAVRHAEEAVSLWVRCDTDELRIEVGDANPAPAELRHAADDEVSGRGLFLVDALATNWGVTDGGKTTWCAFRLPAGRT